jgi:hypothetical protein
MGMVSSTEHMKKALEILKSRNIEPVRHFSPYDEGGEYEVGSALQIFWDRRGNRYDFLFGKDGELVFEMVGMA